jgi:hypothetical protein
VLLFVAAFRSQLAVEPSSRPIDETRPCWHFIEVLRAKAGSLTEDELITALVVAKGAFGHVPHPVQGINPGSHRKDRN